MACGRGLSRGQLRLVIEGMHGAKRWSGRSRSPVLLPAFREFVIGNAATIGGACARGAREIARRYSWNAARARKAPRFNASERTVRRGERMTERNCGGAADGTAISSSRSHWRSAKQNLHALLRVLPTSLDEFLKRTFMFFSAVGVFVFHIFKNRSLSAVPMRTRCARCGWPICVN